MNSGRDELINHWWLAIIPRGVIVLIVLQVSLIDDWLRDQFDPKLKVEGALMEADDERDLCDGCCGGAADRG